MNPDRNSRKYRSGNNLYSDDELELSSSQVLEKVKPDRVTSTKPDEDRRRRTIIVEKKNGSYGFTLQSYGIHYKKEQEVEVITYVDYVEYDGPAYRAGMREGDVILSINGYDMEKAEHKDLVNFIKNCDNRMRMVVLFEDCCRKVELHLKYIQLQDLLKGKMADLERICLRERELLEGKWKTHSLPARKKATAAPGDDVDPGATTDVESGSGPSFCRPASSTEDVKKLLRQKTYIVPPPAQFMLAYHCLDSNYRYVIHPSQASTTVTSDGSGQDYTTTPCGNPNVAKFCKDHQHMMRGSSLDNSSLGGCTPQQQQQHQPHQPAASPTKSLHNYDTKATKSGSSRRSGHLHGHSCNPCMGHFLRSSSSDKQSRAGGTEKDNTSLDAYDLASPCCDPQCVPSRRKSKHHKDHHHKHKHRDREGSAGGKDRIPRPKSQPHISPQQQHPHQQPQPQSQPSYLYGHKAKHDHHHSKVYDLNASLASHCSLHSCTSSEFNPAAEHSPASYSTSISTDTLYWEPHSESTTVSGSGSVHKKPPLGGSTGSSGTLVAVGGRPPTHTHQHHYYIQKYVHPHHGGQPSQLQQQQAQQQQQQQQQQQLAIYPPPPPLPAVHKPKSWDNLAMKGYGGYGYGYGYLEVGGGVGGAGAAGLTKASVLPTATRTQTTITIQHRNSIPKKNGYERYSAFVDVENYAPPPTQFLQETTTTTTTITTKSTENLLGAYNHSDTSLSCDCLETAPLTGSAAGGTLELVHDKAGYYSSLGGSGSGGSVGAAGSGKKSVSNLTEIARL
uniref:PDZ domain-containing protein n=1 Tax=Anopheles atroparvus TaxID=41427 RepID=A0AAG5DC39_ANOAO